MDDCNALKNGVWKNTFFDTQKMKSNSTSTLRNVREEERWKAQKE
jgi:hypothetical protein